MKDLETTNYLAFGPIAAATVLVAATSYLGGYSPDQVIALVKAVPWWPIIVGSAVIIFREELTLLLGRIFKIKAGGVELSLNQDQSTVGEDAASKEVAEKATETTAPSEGRPIEEGRPTDASTEARPPQPSEADVLRAELEFERIYTAIFGGQLQILQHLNSLPQGETAESALYPYYDNARRIYPQLQASFQQYLGFLQSTGLIHRRPNSLGQMVAITPKGRYFLNYIASRGYSLVKPF